MELVLEDLDEISRERTQLLDELILVQADDIGKLDVEEVLLRYFENHKTKHVDAWGNDNQAIRQLYSASHRLPRVRNFPGSKSAPPAPPKAVSGAQNTNHTKRAARVVKARQMQVESQGQLAPEKSKPTTDSTVKEEAIAEQLIQAGSTYSDIEAELCRLAEELSEQCLSKAVYNEQLHSLATKMVTTVIEQVSEQLGDRTAALSRENTQQRVERVAHELVTQVTESAAEHVAEHLEATKELTFMDDRADSIAANLLDQVTEDVEAHFRQS